jgi:ribosomal-protein-alanine N-acetyltransferase
VGKTDVKKIVTPNLYLRPLQVSDITPEYINALNDSEVVRLTEARHQKWTEENVRKYVLDSNVEGVSQLLGIFLKESGRHIGNIRLFNFSEKHRRVELGIMLFDKSQWSRGYGTEAIIGVVDYAFNELRLHKICADYYAINSASARMFQKAGFESEGIFKDHFWLDGKYVDSVRIAKFNKAGDKK